MVRNFGATVLATLLLAFTGSAFAQSPSGTAADAKALLDKAVAAVKADREESYRRLSTIQPAVFVIAISTCSVPAAPTYNFTAHPKADIEGNASCRSGRQERQKAWRRADQGRRRRQDRRSGVYVSACRWNRARLKRSAFVTKAKQPHLRRRLLQVTIFRWPGSTLATIFGC